MVSVDRGARVCGTNNSQARQVQLSRCGSSIEGKRAGEGVLSPAITRRCPWSSRSTGRLSGLESCEGGLAAELPYAGGVPMTRRNQRPRSW